MIASHRVCRYTLVSRTVRLVRQGRGRFRPVAAATPKPAMQNSCDALNDFLASSRAAALGSERCSIVIGNEASDLDSVVSSITYARLLQEKAGPGSLPFVPIMNIPREDLALRPEIPWLFNQVGLDVSRVVFLDEACPAKMKEAGRLHGVILVDHNKATGAQKPLEDNVVEIIDHHDDDGKHQSAVRRVAPVGSCASLVTEKYLDGPQGVAILESERPTRLLLLAAVLMDTSGLTGRSGRCTDEDRRAAAALRQSDVSDEEAKTLYDELRSRRKDQSRLTCAQLLRRDYKEWDMGGWKVGISAMGIRFETLFSREEDRMEDAMAKWREERGLDALLLMTGFEEPAGEFHRQLVCSNAHDGVPPITKLAESMSPPLELKPLPLRIPASAHFAAYSQLNLKASRKQVAPAAAAFFQSEGVAKAGKEAGSAP